ncbi:hypothetical protein Daus18300_008024 [Diaporthe australafricana]|uniref:Uncharacterized protein n=1 Tax=Diaporthe australafricana TaxID=127596 RepID=A0ABR3WJP0_9PEZI
MANPNDDCRLLALPRELRDKIYEHYLQVDGGYVYNFESGKLACAAPAGARKSIDLQLMLSCKQIAQEMQGLALKTNIITFSCVAPPAKRRNLDYHCSTIHHLWNKVFRCLLEGDYDHPLRQSEQEWWPVANFDESVYRMVADAFPKFKPHLRTIQLLASEPHRTGDKFDDTTNFAIPRISFAGEQVQDLLLRATYWGEVPSNQRQAALETLKLTSSRGCWSEEAWSKVDEEGDYRVPTTDPASDSIRYHSLYKPWTILEDDDSHDIDADPHHPAHWRPTRCTEEELDKWFPHRRPNLLSAASIAIYFLESIPAQRTNIRNIILDEIDPCGTYPECHGLGLIEFCKENPRLRIERRANIWKSIWKSDAANYHPDNLWGLDDVDEEDITERVARWIVEALALVPAGMPLGSFTLVLDGNPAPEQCAQLFQRVQRDAAWQTAYGESFDRGHLPETAYHDRRRIRGYTYEDFPQALRDISTGTCRVVRANFDVGEPWDAEP